MWPRFPSSQIRAEQLERQPTAWVRRRGPPHAPRSTEAKAVAGITIQPRVRRVRVDQARQRRRCCVRPRLSSVGLALGGRSGNPPRRRTTTPPVNSARMNSTRGHPAGVGGPALAGGSPLPGCRVVRRRHDGELARGPREHGRRVSVDQCVAVGQVVIVVCRGNRPDFVGDRVDLRNGLVQ